MSIKLGFKNNAYSLEKFNNSDTNLVINTYDTSNAIIINSSIDTNSNSIINFNNKFSTGIIDKAYNITDIEKNQTLCTLSSNCEFFIDLKVKDLLETSRDYSTFSCNLQLNFKDNLNSFKIYNVNKDIIFETTPSHTTINNARVKETLYVNKIENFTGNRIEIVNPTLVGLVLDSVNTDQAISINNAFSKYYSTPTILINRFDNLNNIIDIGTCNIVNNNIQKQFIVNRHGMIGIGTQPDTPISITNIQNTQHIFKYSGSTVGDSIFINKYGNIGMGTIEPKGMIHVNRDDIISQQNPLIRLDIAYESSNNLIQSNNFIDYINSSNYLLYLDKNVVVNITNDFITSNINHMINFINNNAYSNIHNLSYESCNINLFDNNISLRNINTDIYKVKNNYIYPSSLYGYEIPSGFSYSFTDSIINIANSFTVQNIEYTSNTSNFTRSHYFNHELVIMSKDTQKRSGYITDTRNPRYNASNFTKTKGYFSNLDDLIYTITNISENKTSNFVHNLYYNINMTIEDTSNTFLYTTSVIPYIIDPPYFLEMTSNNDFKASISSKGTLSLGSKDKNNKYIFHADGVSMLKKVELYDVYTSNEFINFNNINFSNINIVNTSSNISKIAVINQAYINDIYISNQISSNLYVSNLILNNVSSEYIKMNSSNIHITTKMSLGKDNTSIETSDNTLLRIVVNDKLTNDNSKFKHLKGISIINELNTGGIIRNPSISIQANDDSTPYFNISRKNKVNVLTDYYIRVNNKTFNNNITENSDIFEICCDTLTDSLNRTNYYNSISDQPSFFNHFKLYNLITLGENHNMCLQSTNNLSTQQSFASVNISTFTNATNKISLGFPYGIIEEKSLTIKDWPQYFNNVIGNNSDSTNKYAPYMLNIFGNVSIASIHGKSMMTLRTDNGYIRNKTDEVVNIVIGSVTESTAQVTVNGGIHYTGLLTQPSDSNIKRDIFKIENALEKVKSISGYTFTNIQTSRKDTGLIAQEVIKVLPEVITRNETTDLLSISYANIMGLIVEAIKDIDNKFEKMSNRIDRIEKNINFILKNSV